MLSVVMPIRNEESFITETLESILAAAAEVRSLEIVVVDGESDDSTGACVSAFGAAHPEVALREIDNPAQIAAAGPESWYRSRGWGSDREGRRPLPTARRGTSRPPWSPSSMRRSAA